MLEAMSENVGVNLFGERKGMVGSCKLKKMEEIQGKVDRSGASVRTGGCEGKCFACVREVHHTRRDRWNLAGIWSSERNSFC